MKKSFLNKTMGIACLILLASCNGGGGGGGGSVSVGSGGGGGGPTGGDFQTPDITVDRFVSALNETDGRTVDISEVELYTDETFRNADIGEEDWFVIYDAKFDEFKAVSLQYVRSIVYFDFFQNDLGTTDEFRAIESDDIFNGDLNGDFFGDDYEVVDYDSFTDSYFGRNSGFEYEDEDETTDVALMVGEQEKLAFFKKAANISYAFNVDLSTAMSLSSLGTKVEKMMGDNNGEITAEDQVEVMGNIENLTGVGLSEMLGALNDGKKKTEVLDKIANKIGTSASNLESKLLPEMFGIEL